MSKFDFNFNGLDDLSKMLDNMQKQAESFDGSLTIDVDNIKENLDKFNDDFKTNFSLSTTDEEYQEYFGNKYTNLMQEHLTDNFNYKKHFNDIYRGYAHID